MWSNHECEYVGRNVSAHRVMDSYQEKYVDIEQLSSCVKKWEVAWSSLYSPFLASPPYKCSRPPLSNPIHVYTWLPLPTFEFCHQKHFPAGWVIVSVYIIVCCHHLATTFIRTPNTSWQIMYTMAAVGYLMFVHLSQTYLLNISTTRPGF